MRPALRKAILFTVLFGIVGYLALDSADDAGSKRIASSVAAKGDAGKAVVAASRYALPDRAALGAPQAQLFGPQSWQPTASDRRAKSAEPAVPKVPVMPYRYAGKVLHEGRMKIFLAKGDEVIAIRKGDTLDRVYRVQSIEKTRITLLYLPLARRQTIPVDSALPLAGAQAAPDTAAESSAGESPPSSARASPPSSARASPPMTTGSPKTQGSARLVATDAKARRTSAQLLRERP